jgi:hypothetical protein
MGIKSNNEEGGSDVGNDDKLCQIIEPEDGIEVVPKGVQRARARLVQ